MTWQNKGFLVGFSVGVWLVLSLAAGRSEASPKRWGFVAAAHETLRSFEDPTEETLADLPSEEAADAVPEPPAQEESDAKTSKKGKKAATTIKVETEGFERDISPNDPSTD